MKNRNGVNTGISDSADKADIKQKSSTPDCADAAILTNDLVE